MNRLVLSAKNMKQDASATFLSVLLIAVSYALILLVIQLQQQTDDYLKNQIAPIDMVIGAKGSPLQLILSSVLHIDKPTGNIPWEEAEKIRKHPLVATSIPLAYGDNAQGFRIVGTNHSYAKLYDLNIQEGRLWESYFEVTVGHEVAKALNLSLGDTLISAHGLVGNLEEHDSHPYIVRGIFEPSSSPIDRLILTDIHSIWEAHSDHGHNDSEQVDAHKHEHNNVDANDHNEKEQVDAHNHEHNHANEEYTAVLIKFRSLAGLMQLPRLVNEETSMQAAVPSIEMDRLLNLIGNGALALQIAGIIILILSAISLFIQMYRSFQKRRYEWALMRVYGASSFYASTVLLLEAIWIAVLGIISGWMLARISQWLLSRLELSPLLREISIPLLGLSDAYLMVSVFSIALIAAIVPIAKGVRMDLSETLSG